MSRQRKAGAARGPSQRQLRVGELLRHALADILARDEVDDPGLRGVAITVCEVTVSPDLRKATAYVLPLGGEHGEEALAALRRARRFLRGRVGHMVELKYVPDLDFALDTSFAYSQAIGELFASSAVRRDVEAGGED